jgi:hypothetical protein
LRDPTGDLLNLFTAMYDEIMTRAAAIEPFSLALQEYAPVVEVSADVLIDDKPCRKDD